MQAVLIGVCCVCISILGCAHDNLKPAEHAGTESYRLEAGDLDRLKQLAQSGNPDAAERVAGYYIFYKGDSRGGLKWLELGAKNGSQHARTTARKIRQALKEAN